VNKVFKCGGAITANGGALHSSQLFKLFDDTDNPTYNDGATPPTTEQLINALHVAADTACEVQIGYCNAGKSTFVPKWGTLSTKAAAGGIVRQFQDDRPLIAFTAANIPAIRIIVSADATVYVGGDIDFAPRQGA